MKEIDHLLFYDILTRQPNLTKCSESMYEAYLQLVKTFNMGGKLMVCGNGGSASDSNHIATELMKSFLKHRNLNLNQKKRFKHLYGNKGFEIASKLEKSLPTLSLTSNTALLSAISNDIDSSMIYAQQIYGYGRKEDTLMAISTSGNSENVNNAVIVAKCLGIKVILLTGNKNGIITDSCDILIDVPSDETHVIQEYHSMIYHALCAEVEKTFFNSSSEI